MGFPKEGPQRPHKHKDPAMVYIYICIYGIAYTIFGIWYIHISIRILDVGSKAFNPGGLQTLWFVGPLCSCGLLGPHRFKTCAAALYP